MTTPPRYLDVPIKPGHEEVPTLQSQEEVMVIQLDVLA